jgi:hypothetical protein
MARNVNNIEKFKTLIISGRPSANVFGYKAAEPTAPFGETGAAVLVILVGCKVLIIIRTTRRFITVPKTTY